MRQIVSQHLILYYIILYMRQTSRYLSMNKREELNKIVKDSIAQSIFQLMKRKRFSDITITEIVKKQELLEHHFIVILLIKKTLYLII